jgi:hypothetical protein
MKIDFLGFQSFTGLFHPNLIGSLLQFYEEGLRNRVIGTLLISNLLFFNGNPTLSDPTLIKIQLIKVEVL